MNAVAASPCPPAFEGECEADWQLAATGSLEQATRLARAAAGLQPTRKGAPGQAIHRGRTAALELQVELELPQQPQIDAFASNQAAVVVELHHIDRRFEGRL